MNVSEEKRKLTESITIPRDLLKQLHEGLIRVEEALATLEELMNKDGMRRVKKAEEEYRKGEYTVIENAEELKEKLK